MPNSAAYDRAFVEHQRLFPNCSRADRHRAGLEAERIAVFGRGYKLDSQGRPYNDSIGSKLNQTQNSIDAYIKTQSVRVGGPEKGYNETLKRMEAELAETNKRRAQEESRRASEWSSEIMPVVAGDHPNAR